MKVLKERKWYVVFMVLVLVFTVALTACGVDKKAVDSSSAKKADDQTKKQLRMVMVTNTAGIGDGGFNDMAWAGFKKAKEELGADIKVIEAREQSQYVTNLSAAAEQGYDMVVAVGFLLQDAIKEVAPSYPKTNFVLIDGFVEQPNVASIIFKENEAAYLAGAIAGMMTKTNKIGFVGGMETPPPIRFESGWRAGIMTTNPEAKISTSYVGSFGDPGKGKETALAQYNNGVDIIQEVAGLSGLGVIEAAKASNKWFVACDKDKTELGQGKQLTADIKRIDNAVIKAAIDIKGGKFKGGLVKLGLKEDGVGLSEKTASVVPDNIMKVVEVLKQKIINGGLVIPENREALKSFTPPKL